MVNMVIDFPKDGEQRRPVRHILDEGRSSAIYDRMMCGAGRPRDVRVRDTEEEAARLIAGDPDMYLKCMPVAPDPAAQLFMRREIAVTVRLEELRGEVARLARELVAALLERDHANARTDALERHLLALAEERRRPARRRPGELRSVGWDPEGE